MANNIFETYRTEESTATSIGEMLKIFSSLETHVVDKKHEFTDFSFDNVYLSTLREYVLNNYENVNFYSLEFLESLRNHFLVSQNQCNLIKVSQ